MIKPLIIANWKCNPATQIEARRLFDVVAGELKNIKNVEVVLCPPFVWLPLLIGSSSASVPRQARDFGGLAFGSQDLFWEKQGSYTGEISPLMLKDLGCEYVIVGHSERRQHLGETDEMINKKLKAALKNRLKPILCVGEKIRDSFDSDGRPENYINPIVEEQLKKALEGIGKSDIGDVIVAYEPVWAIGAGEPDTPDDALSASLLIRKMIVKMFDSRALANKIRVIYGGSVDSKNVVSFTKQDGIDGVLVGGASINGSEFSKIVKILSH